MKHLSIQVWIILALAALIAAMALGCDKDNGPAKDSELRSFSHLEAEMDSMYIGEITQIRAIYDGDNVTFEWEASSGDILGSGHTVEYLAASCTEPEATITCKAIAKNQSKTRSISIYVY